MDVGHIILGKPWLYDLDVTNFGKTKNFIFNFGSGKVRHHPLPPKDIADKKKVSDIGSSEKDRDLKGKNLDMGPGETEKDPKGKNVTSKGIHILNGIGF